MLILPYICSTVCPFPLVNSLLTIIFPWSEWVEPSVEKMRVKTSYTSWWCNFDFLKTIQQDFIIFFSSKDPNAILRHTLWCITIVVVFNTLTITRKIEWLQWAYFSEFNCRKCFSQSESIIKRNSIPKTTEDHFTPSLYYWTCIILRFI